jgi:Rrf2 family protein
MQVSRRVDYALRALAYLAAQTDRRVVGRAEIEERQRIPRSFLAKILRRLVAAGLLESVPGVHGGFHLRVAPAQVSVRQVYEAVEGELALIDCLRGDVCQFDPVCSQIDVWRGAQRRLTAYLDGISIADLADGQGLAARLAATRRR